MGQDEQLHPDMLKKSAKFWANFFGKNPNMGAQLTADHCRQLAQILSSFDKTEENLPNLESRNPEDETKNVGTKNVDEKSVDWDELRKKLDFYADAARRWAADTPYERHMGWERMGWMAEDLEKLAATLPAATEPETDLRGE